MIKSDRIGQYHQKKQKSYEKLYLEVRDLKNWLDFGFFPSRRRADYSGDYVNDWH